MGQVKIIISREAAIVGSLTKRKIELDGFVVGVLKNGQTIEITASDGNHILKFFALGKCEKTININIAEGTQTIHINIKYNKLSGKLELQTDDTQNISTNNANVNQKQNRKGFSVVAAIAIVIVVFVSVISFVYIMSDTSTIENNSPKTSHEQILYNGEKEIYKDEKIKITYLGLSDPKSGLTLFNMSLKLENNFNKNVFTTLTDSYINDTAVQFLGGNLSFEGIKPNKKGVCVFTFGYDKMGISKIEDINKIEFKIKLVNPDDFSEIILETDTITLTNE